MHSNNYLEIAKTYADQVISDAIPSCNEVKQAAKRFLNDIKREDILIKEEKINRVCAFIEMLNLVDSFARQKFILQPWQIFILANIYGFYSLDGFRRYKKIYIEMARKQGKSAFIGAIMIYENIFSEGTQNIVAANSREQARVLLKMAKAFSGQLDPNNKQLKRLNNSIRFDKRDNQLFIISADASYGDGYNPSTYVLDEFHAAKSEDLRNVLRSGQLARANPLEIIITTAGDNLDSPCFEYRTTCKEVLAGNILNDNLFAIIYTQDSEDEIYDPSLWVKSNPNLGVSVFKNNLQDELNDYKNRPSQIKNLLIKNYNIWQQGADEFWLTADDMLEVSKESLQVPLDKPVFVGVDLASVSDLTAVAYAWKDENKKINIKVDYYLPSDSTNTVTNKEYFKNMAGKKYLTLNQGNVTDYNIITDHLKRYRVQEIYYDRYNALSWAVDCSNYFNMQPFSQTAGNFNLVTREFERLVKTKQVVIDNNPLTRWCFGNCCLFTDRNNNVKPQKAGAESKKIDGVIASLQALAALIDNN